MRSESYLITLPQVILKHFVPSAVIEMDKRIESHV